MENLHARHLPGQFQTADFAALGIAARIATRGHDHQYGVQRFPAKVKARQFAITSGEQGRQQIGFQAQHQYLAFRIAKTHIKFNQLWACRGNHQPREKHAFEGRTAPRHFGQYRADDARHDILLKCLSENRRWGIGAHAASIGAGIAIPHPLMVLRGTQRQSGGAITQREETDFLTHQAFLDDYGSPRRAMDAVFHDMGNGGFSFGDSRGHHHTLAGGEPIRFHHNRRALFTNIGARGGGIGEARPGGGGRAGGIRHFLGEGFAAFQSCSSGRGAKAFQARSGAGIGQAKRERRFRPDHHQINGPVLGEGNQAGNILGTNRDTFRHFGNAGIAWRAEQLGQQRRCRQCPAERVFAATATHYQNAHRNLRRQFAKR